MGIVRGLSTVLLSVVVLVSLGGCTAVRRGTSARKVHRHDTSSQVHYRHRHTGRDQKKLLSEAETWMGTPYKFGGKEKGNGADCSGFVMMVYLNALDVKLPRTTVRQSEFCKPVKESEVRIGDLVFFATGKDPERVSHVGMIIDEEGTFIHASSSKGVCHSTMNNPYYQRHFLMYGRVPAATDK